MIQSSAATTDIPSFASARLTERALLVALNIREWRGRRRDREVTNRIARENGAESAAGCYTKTLVPKTFLATIGQVRSEAREVAAEEQRREHPVDAVGSLRDVLDGEDGAHWKLQKPRRRHRMQEGQVAAHEHPIGVSAMHDAKPSPGARPRELLHRREPRHADGR